jgi:hypothetical protein
VTGDEILAAAGDYNAERVVVDLLAREDIPNRMHENHVADILRTFHLATIVRFLRGLGDSLHVSDDILEAAVQNQTSGKEILKYVLDQRGDEVRITDGIVEAAARNPASGKQILHLLLGRQGEEIWASDAVLDVARKYLERLF